MELLSCPLHFLDVLTFTLMTLPSTNGRLCSFCPFMVKQPFSNFNAPAEVSNPSATKYLQASNAEVIQATSSKFNCCNPDK